MVNLIKDYTFKGYVAIEYSGGFISMYSDKRKKYFSSHDGIKATKKLIEKYL